MKHPAWTKRLPPATYNDDAQKAAAAESARATALAYGEIADAELAIRAARARLARRGIDTPHPDGWSNRE